MKRSVEERRDRDSLIVDIIFAAAAATLLLPAVILAVGIAL